MVQLRTVSVLSDLMTYVEKNCTIGRFLNKRRRQDWPLPPKIARKSGVRDRRKEREILAEFKRRSMPYLNLKLENDWN